MNISSEWTYRLLICSICINKNIHTFSTLWKSQNTYIYNYDMGQSDLRVIPVVKEKRTRYNMFIVCCLNTLGTMLPNWNKNINNILLVYVSGRWTSRIGVALLCHGDCWTNQCRLVVSRRPNSVALLCLGDYKNNQGSHTTGDRCNTRLTTMNYVYKKRGPQ